jgi:hypothetical protein
MSNDNYLLESSFSSWSELNTGNSLDSNSVASLSTNGNNQNTNTEYLLINSNNSSNNYFQNLITYELERPNTHVGFGFDLKGDRPAIVGSVRKGSIAEKVGLREGDLVISINNKKVTDLDHDQVVRHIGLTKNRLLLQITKIKYDNVQTNNSKNNKINEKNNIKYKNENKLAKKNINPSSKLYNESTKNQILREKIPLTTAANNLYYIKNDTLDSLTNNTKTTEDDEEDSDIDYDFFLMTGRRRQRRHHHHHHYYHHHHNHRHSKKRSSRNLIVKHLQKPSSSKQLSNSADEFVNDENIDFEINNDYENEETEDTEDTEDTEGNLNPLSDFKKKCSNFKICKFNFLI